MKEICLYDILEIKKKDEDLFNQIIDKEREFVRKKENWGTDVIVDYLNSKLKNSNIKFILEKKLNKYKIKSTYINCKDTNLYDHSAYGKLNALSKKLIQEKTCGGLVVSNIIDEHKRKVYKQSLSFWEILEIVIEEALEYMLEKLEKYDKDETKIMFNDDYVVKYLMDNEILYYKEDEKLKHIVEF